MKRINKYAFGAILLSALLLSVGMASAETYVITGGGGIVTVNGPSIDKFTGGSVAASVGDVTVADTNVVTSSNSGVSSSGATSASSEDKIAASGSVSWANVKDTSAGYAYAVSIGIPEESANIVSTDAATDVEGSVDGFFTIEAEGTANVN